MATFKVFLAVCAVASTLLLQAECACDSSAFSGCAFDLLTDVGSASGGSTAYCTAYKTYLTCAENADCASNSAYTSNKSAYDSACGGAEQYLLSWPLYMVVMALTLRRVYNSME